MKLNVAPDATFARRIGREVPAAVRRRLERELQDELRQVSDFGFAADPDARRDALERAVRRVWGAPL